MPAKPGVSASASVVAIGAARAHDDQALAGPLTGLAEAIGMPVQLGSTKRYLFGMLPVGDAFLAWSAATRPVEEAGEPHPAVVSWWWRLPWHVATLVGMALAWLPLWWPHLRRLRSPDVPASGSPESPPGVADPDPVSSTPGQR